MAGKAGWLFWVLFSSVVQPELGSAGALLEASGSQIKESWEKKSLNPQPQIYSPALGPMEGPGNVFLVDGSLRLHSGRNIHTLCRRAMLTS